MFKYNTINTNSGFPRRLVNFKKFETKQFIYNIRKASLKDVINLNLKSDTDEEKNSNPYRA